MDFRSAVLGPIPETIGNTEKFDMKIGKNFEPLLKEQFKCRTLKN